MSELERIVMQANLTQILDEWLDKQMESYSISCCSELARMMAVAAISVLEASTVAEAEAASQEGK